MNAESDELAHGDEERVATTRACTTAAPPSPLPLPLRTKRPSAAPRLTPVLLNGAAPVLPDPFHLFALSSSE